ncbi:MAG TPA: hypothetical protein GX702_04005 [Chloroflexi bacterium]|nr:hypothetical protein [Chloroflexota bacterium]
MEHPGDVQLQSLEDGELDPDSAQRLRDHIAFCPRCASRLAEWRRLSLLVRETAPSPALFSSEGKFWGRLAGRLKRPGRSSRCRPLWPWVPFMPPVLLGVFNSVAQTLLSAALIIHVLAGLGVFNPASFITQGLIGLARWPLLESTLYRWLGWSSEQAVQVLIGPWSRLGYDGQHALLLLTIVTVLGIVLLLLLVLSLWWAVLWMQPHAHGLRRR